MSVPESITKELTWRRDMCGVKRGELLAQARRREKRYKLLSFISGVLGLLSTLAATTIFTELTNSTVVKIITALIMFVSGVLGLLVAFFSDPKENSLLFAGASEFLVLRDKITGELHRTSLTEAQAIALVKKYAEEYGRVSGKYDRYMQIHSSRGSHLHRIMAREKKGHESQSIEEMYIEESAYESRRRAGDEDD